MKKKNIYINCLPFVIWIGLFALGLISESLTTFIGLSKILLLFIVPVFYGIYNFCVTDKVEEMYNLFVISLVSQLMGLLLNGILHYSFISSDSETALVIKAFLLITLICTVIIDLIAILIKLLNNKMRK